MANKKKTSISLTDTCKDLLEKIAAARGLVGMSSVIEMLAREEAKRENIPMPKPETGK